MDGVNFNVGAIVLKYKQDLLISDTIANPIYSDELHLIIWKILLDCRLSYGEFSERCFLALAGKDFSPIQLINRRNDFIKAITGRRKISYVMFKFIVCNIMGKHIPDDPILIQFEELNKIKENGLYGKVFGRLTVIDYAGLTGVENRPSWLCKCSCNNELVVIAKSLISGNTTSCGCYKRDNTRKLMTTHGKKHTPEYSVWTSMKQRCINPNNEYYVNYGGRGITVCDRWRESFENFYEDMGDRPKVLQLIVLITMVIMNLVIVAGLHLLNRHVIVEITL